MKNQPNTAADAPKTKADAAAADDRVVFLRFPDPGHRSDCGPGAESDTPADAGAGETARALDALILLEAIGRTGSKGDHGTEGGARLGALILVSGLPVEDVIEIVHLLEGAGLVAASCRFRCFTITGVGRGALEDLGIYVGGVGEDLAATPPALAFGEGS